MTPEHQHHLLIIEDDQGLANSMKILFSRSGFTVDTASNASESRMRIDEHRPCFIFLDILLPGESGLEFLEELRRDKSFKNTPIFVLTQFHDEAYQQEAKRLNVTAYFVKAEHSLKDIMDQVMKALEKCRRGDCGPWEGHQESVATEEQSIKKKKPRST